MEGGDFDLALVVETFLAESSENLESMEEALLALEVHPQDAERIHTVFRMAHSIKGDAACVGFTAVRDFAHAVEDLLDRVRAGTVEASPPLITTLLHAVDVVRELIAAAAGGRHELTESEREVLDVIASFSGEAVECSVTEPAAETARRSLRVDTARLDQMLDLTGEIAIARGRLRQMLESMPLQVAESALESLHDLERRFFDLQELVMRVRMVPIGPFFRQQARLVRDIAVAEGKQAQLVVEGADVEIDNSMLDRIRQPLAHMLRNALHHGIESPEARIAAGKSATGRITLSAHHEAGTIVIEIVDDGRGIDRESLVARAVATGAIAEGEKLDHDAAIELIFRPGLSTAKSVTGTAGRGVGMDVVRRNVEAIHGSVHVRSVSGEGTAISLRLPLTLAIIEGFAVSVADERYIIPHEFVLECVELADGTRHGATGVMTLRGQPLPFVRLGTFFGLPHREDVRGNVVVIECNGMRAGIAVDGLHSQLQVVIKPMSKLFGTLRPVAGSAILGDGRVALILDVPALVKELVATERAA